MSWRAGGAVLGLAPLVLRVKPGLPQKHGPANPSHQPGRLKWLPALEGPVKLGARINLEDSGASVEEGGAAEAHHGQHQANIFADSEGDFAAPAARPPPWNELGWKT